MRQKKYRIGASFKIIDPETNAPAIKNPFPQPKSGLLLVDDMALDRPLARGVVFGAYNIALHVQVKCLLVTPGLGRKKPAKEWVASMVSGVAIIPSGTWGVTRAEEAGCTYCAGG
jgi:hypothetical protein